jgi:hypothetical protein
MLHEENQIHNFLSSSGSGTVINYCSGCGFLQVTVPVPLVKKLRFRFRFRFHNGEGGGGGQEILFGNLLLAAGINLLICTVKAGNFVTFFAQINFFLKFF